MLNLRNFRSLENGLATAMQEPRGLEQLSCLKKCSIEEISRAAVREDWYGDKKLIESSVAKVWKTASIESIVAHSIWCAHREAAWLKQAGRSISNDVGFQFHKPQYLRQTQNSPTVVITPMSVGTHDAINIVIEAMHRFDPRRKIVFYGENMQRYMELHPEHKGLFADNSIKGTKKIIETLGGGGLFFTYPDFVYKGHQIISGELFGTTRAFSSSFLNIILRCKAALLPMTIMKSDEELHMRFYPLIPSNSTVEYNMLPHAVRIQLQCLLVGKILEGLIIQIPNQWRLLATLTHQSAEMA